MAPIIQPPTPIRMRQMPLEFGDARSPELDALVVEHNDALSDWLAPWLAGGPAPTLRSPVYLWGAPGSGKSHVLQALALKAQRWQWHVMLLDEAGLQCHAAATEHAPTLVLLDDCERMDETCQHWAFDMFIESAALAGSDSPLLIVGAGACPPVDLPVREDLRTRLGWGLVLGMQPLSETAVKDVLEHECQRRGLNWADGVLPYIMTRFDRNLGHLMPLIDRLDRYALAEKRIITVPLLKQMLEESASDTHP